MRARLARSDRPDRIFETVLEVAKAAGLVGRKRVLDSTALYDAVATMDTVTLVRSAIRGLLKAADADLQTELRGLLGRDDDYAVAGKPVCDYDDAAAREALVDALARDATALLAALDGRELGRRAGPGRGAAGHRGGPGPRARHRRGVPHRPPSRQGSGDLHGGPATRGTGTRPRRVVSTATRATWRPTRTARSSPPRRSARATPVTQTGRRDCWPTT